MNSQNYYRASDLTQQPNGMPFITKQPSQKQKQQQEVPVVVFADPSHKRRPTENNKTTTRPGSERCSGASRSASGTASGSSATATTTPATETSFALMRQVESYAAQHLTGKARKNYLLSKIDASLNHIRLKNDRSTRQQKPRVPRTMALGMYAKAKQRALKRKEEVRQSGEQVIVSSQVQAAVRCGQSDLVFSSGSHPLLRSVEREQVKQVVRKVAGSDRRVDRGLKMGVGKFKQGVLHVSRSERDRVMADGIGSKSGDKSGDKKGGNKKGGGKKGGKSFSKKPHRNGPRKGRK